MAQNAMTTKPFIRSLGTVLLLLSVLGGCSQKSVTPQTPASTTRPSEGNTTLYQQGIDAMAIKDFATAALIFERFIADNPGLSGGYINLALIHFKQDKLEAALEQVQQALQVNPDNAAAYNLHGQIQLQQGQVKLARQDFEKAVELAPDYTNAHYNLALLYDIYLQEIDLALEHYNRYLSLTTEKDERTREWVDYLKSLKNG